MTGYPNQRLWQYADMPHYCYYLWRGLAWDSLIGMWITGMLTPEG